MISTGPSPRANSRALASARRPEIPAPFCGNRLTSGPSSARSSGPASRARRRRARSRGATSARPGARPDRSAPPGARRSGRRPSSGSSAGRTVPGRGARAISRTAGGSVVGQARPLRAQLCSKRYTVPAGVGGSSREPRHGAASTSANTSGCEPISSISLATGVVLAGHDLVGVVGDEARSARRAARARRTARSQARRSG